MKLIVKLSLGLVLGVFAQYSLASYDAIRSQVCDDLVNNLPEHEKETRIPQEPYPLVSSSNKYTWEKSSCYIDDSTLTDKNHDFIIDISGKNERGEWVGIDAKISCLFTSDYEWACLYSYITHNLYYELRLIQFGLQWQGLWPSQQDLLDGALKATNQYL